MIREWIRREGRIVGREFLRVDGFLNHRIVPEFIEAVGGELAGRFAESGATCVLTAEAAGNIVAYELARRLGARGLREEGEGFDHGAANHPGDRVAHQGRADDALGFGGIPDGSRTRAGGR